MSVNTINGHLLRVSLIAGVWLGYRIYIETLESCVVQIRNRSQRKDYYDDHQSIEVKYISTLRELANVDIKYSHMDWSLAIFVKINIYSVASMIERFQLFNEDRNETKSGQQIKNTKFSTSRKLIEANYNILDKYLLWINNRDVWNIQILVLFPSTKAMEWTMLWL